MTNDELMYGYTTKNILTSRDVHEALQAKTEALGSRPRRDGETEAFANLSKVRPRHSSSRLTQVHRVQGEAL
jgi:hypothetical protein